MDCYVLCDRVVRKECSNRVRIGEVVREWYKVEGRVRVYQW